MPHFSSISSADPPEDPLFIAEYGDAPSLDLHGYDIHGALFELDHFIQRFRGKQPIAIQIIHGHGHGRLREAIHTWLKKSPYVLQFRDAERFDQAGAVTYVLV